MYPKPLLLFVTGALAAGEFDVKRTVMVRAADIIHWPFTRAIAVALAFAKERQHALTVYPQVDLTFCVRVEY